MPVAAPLVIPFKALRAPWLDEPDVDIHQTDARVVRQHPYYGVGLHCGRTRWLN